MTLPGQPASGRQPSGARAEFRRQLRQATRTRNAALFLIALVIVAAPLAYLVVREAAKDPVFAEFDQWSLPDWAAGKHTDEAYGSRWCIRECRYRERTWESSRSPQETDRAYGTVLREAGWLPWRSANCEEANGPSEGLHSCWQRDEYVLDLWVRSAPCEVKQLRPTVGNPSAAAPAANGAPGSAPGGGQSGAGGGAKSATPGQAVSLGAGCGVALATVKVFNRIAYQTDESDSGAAGPGQGHTVD